MTEKARNRFIVDQPRPRSAGIKQIRSPTACGDQTTATTLIARAQPIAGTRRGAEE